MKPKSLTQLILFYYQARKKKIQYLVKEDKVKCKFTINCIEFDISTTLNYFTFNIKNSNLPDKL